MALSTQRLPLNASESSRACIIFDWDDTLCPTWWMQKVLVPALEKSKADSIKEELHWYASIVEEILRSACEVAYVDILTQADPTWVAKSLDYLNLSGINIEGILKDLKISIHHTDFEEARERVNTQLDLPTAAKMISMCRILKARFGDSPTAQWNALSIGDRPTELRALKEACREQARRVWRRPICKTLKLPEEPMLDELGHNLKTLTPQLTSLVDRITDVEITVSAKNR